MLRVDLVELDRVGSCEIREVIAPDAEVWAATDAAPTPGPAPDPSAGLLDPRLLSPVSVDLRFTRTLGGQILARGEIRGSVDRECRRCLEPVEIGVRQSLDLVWLEEEETESDGDVRFLDPSAVALDLEPVIREEFLLLVPEFVLCKPDCRGLCPVCGANRNHETCDCSLDEPDPRWEALRTLKRDQE
jgi:uncharacterized protein